jgi:putative flippase GtrA
MKNLLTGCNILVVEIKTKIIDQAEVTRYIINGLLATGVHFSVLTFNMQIYEMRSAGLANVIAAIFGISASFLGSRYFVFKKYEGHIFSQAMMFLILYGSIACLHGFVLLGWTDIYGYDYRIGFVFATILQVMLSYWGNKMLVFKK